MKKLFLLIYSLVCINCIAQQNFINVPSSEVTVKHKLFFQQQLNFNELIQSNSTLDFGLGNGFEVGLNVLGLNFNNRQKSFLNNDTTDTDPYNPLVLLNGLKQFEISEKASVGVGSQFGMNFTDNKKISNANLTYVNLLLKDVLVKNSALVLGTYYNSHHYGGQGNRFGAWFGAEIPIQQNFHLMTESVIGSNSLCYTSVGLIYYPYKWMPLTIGVQIPNTKNNAYSLVFEFTIIPLGKKQPSTF